MFVQRFRQLGKILLGAFALVIRPLIRRIRLFQDRLIFEIKRLVLRMPALIADHGTDGREYRREDGDHLCEASIFIIVCGVFDRVIVRSVYMKFST